MPDLTGKTILVTGASSGIGTETAAALAELGAAVVMTARSEARGADALAAVRARAVDPGRVTHLSLDLGDLAGIRAAVDELRRQTDRLDVLVNNAGAVHQTRKVTTDGFEMTFGANHLGTFALTVLLRDLLFKGAPSRVVTVASAAHQAAKMVWDDLQDERRGYIGVRAYNQSKLANILFTVGLARRLQGTGVTATCLHPGVVATGFGKNDSGWFSKLVALGGPFLLSPASGAATSVYLASSPDVEGQSGGYYAKCRPKKPTAAARDAEAAERLWALSEELTEIRWEG